MDQYKRETAWSDHVNKDPEKPVDYFRTPPKLKPPKDAEEAYDAVADTCHCGQPMGDEDEDSEGPHGGPKITIVIEMDTLSTPGTAPWPSDKGVKDFIGARQKKRDDEENKEEDDESS